MTGRIALAMVLALAALDGCRARDNDPGPGGVTVGEARALDEAARMLENRPQAPPLDRTSDAASAPAPKPNGAAPPR